MKTLLLCRRPPSPARPDAAVVVWDEVELSGEEKARIDAEAIAWTKRWGHAPLRAGRSFHQLTRWKGVSFWWFAEVFLHYSTDACRYVRTIETLALVLDRHRPDEVETDDLPVEETILLARLCEARGVLFHGAVPRVPFARRWATFVTSLRSRWNTAKTVAGVLKTSVARPPRVSENGRRRVLFLSHAAFWRERQEPDTGAATPYEHYFDQIIPGVSAEAALEPFVVAVGPRTAFRRRDVKAQLGDWVQWRPEAGPYVHMQRYTSPRVLKETWRGTREVRRLWSWLRRSPAVAEAFSHRGVRFVDLSMLDLARTVLLQLPWAVRVYEEAAEVLRAVRPSVVCLYNESGGLGRAVIAAARAAGVPSVGIQHGILYPRYYSYTYTAAETDAPRPDRTAVFGESARRELVAQGHYAAESLVLTGSPKFDQLLEASRKWDRAAVRTRLGISAGTRLIVVASRFRGIRATHQCIGSAFPSFVRAVEALPDVVALVKPHPAEPARPYEGVIADLRAARVRVLAPQTPLLDLLHAADLVVTVESLSAVEALVLGRPLVILNTPTNLQEMVEAGVALGVPEGQDPRPALEAALFAAEDRARLEASRTAYLSDLAFGVDGQATGRIVELIKETALGVPVVALGTS
jgi:hypothetical protein